MLSKGIHTDNIEETILIERGYGYEPIRFDYTYSPNNRQKEIKLVIKKILKIQRSKLGK